MPETEKEQVWVNTLMAKSLAKVLDLMVEEDGSDRAKFMRMLVKQEAVRRGYIAQGTKKNRMSDRVLAEA